MTNSSPDRKSAWVGRVSAATGGQPQRVTQGFVANLTWTWRHPSLTLIEIAWRWLFGGPALWLFWIVWNHALARVPWRATGVLRVSANQLLTDPMGAAAALGAFFALMLTPLGEAARWMVPLLLMAWIVLSAMGRTLLLRRMDASLRSRTGTMLGLQSLRVLLSCAVSAVWWFGVQWLARVTIAQPIADGGDPQMMLYTGGVIVSSLGLFVLASGVSWVFSAAPLVAMREGAGVFRSLRRATQAHGARAGMAEINLVLSVVKIMLVVLAMAFSAFPLPFTTVVTEGYVLLWSGLVAIWYFAASDFFHVTRLHAFNELLRRRELTQRQSDASE